MTLCAQDAFDEHLSVTEVIASQDLTLLRTTPWPNTPCRRCRTTYGALEPHIDAKTMEIHHTKHHQAYITNLNNALKDHPQLQGKTIEDLIVTPRRRSRSDPDGRAQQRRRARQSLAVLADHEARRRRRARPARWRQAITSELGGFAAFKEAFGKAALGRFGSGWAWLILGKDGKLAVTSTPNQDSPIMDGTDAHSWASTSGSTPTTSSIRTGGPITSPPGGTRSTGTRSAGATRRPRSRSRESFDSAPLHDDPRDRSHDAALGKDSRPSRASVLPFPHDPHHLESALDRPFWKWVWGGAVIAPSGGNEQVAHFRLDARWYRAPRNEEFMSMDRHSRVFGRRMFGRDACGHRLDRHPAAAACGTMFRPGKPYSTTGSGPPPVGFNSDPHPNTSVGQVYGNPLTPGRIARREFRGAGSPAQFGTPPPEHQPATVRQRPTGTAPCRERCPPAPTQ